MREDMLVVHCSRGSKNRKASNELWSLGTDAWERMGQVLTPATTKQWAEAAAYASRAPVRPPARGSARAGAVAKRRSRCGLQVAVLNGVASNGYPQFDMAYYL